MPTLYASKSKKKALWYSFLAGIAEPIGALIAFAFLGAFIDNFILHLIIGGVAGVMVFICFDELLPQAYERGNSHSIIFGIFAGMAVMAFSLYLL
jgi:ZIP family zinc transporter